MSSKQMRLLVGELESIRKGPHDPGTEKRMRELSFKIGRSIPKKILNRALEHPREIRDLIHPQDKEQHPVFH